ncbi:MAG TPA: c-type cytochrome [Candidatus Binatia bacterium]|nr:c-type cytochrome [Candidatus Binatia bacterium]
MKIVLLSVFVAVASAAAADAQTPAFPPGPDGAAIRYGYELVTQTQKLMPGNVTATLSCASCHLDAGRKAHAAPFRSIVALYPRWESRAHRVVSLQDRIAECFLYSMNGTPPAYYSREMIGIVAYIAYLSRTAPAEASDQGFVKVRPPRPADAKAGAVIYAAQCAACHGSGGAGNAQAHVPPLWGPNSFNDGAGMNYGLKFKMAEFVKANMPIGREGSLGDQQAVDVAAYVNSHARPRFNPARLITFPGRRAGFF